MTIEDDRPRRGKKPRKKAERKPREPREETPASLERAAFAYLERFDTSVANLRRVLKRRLRRSAQRDDGDALAALETAIEALLERLQRARLLDDTRFAENVARGQRQRGASARAIAMRLRARGVAEMDAEAAMGRADQDADGEAELEAARQLVRRKRLGPHRPAEARAEMAQKDLAKLARAGFSYDVARRALLPDDDG